MEIAEPVERINKSLIDLFGVDTITGLPIWRVTWSEDQYENRLGTYDDYTPGGIYIRTVTEVRKVPKYKQWIHLKYILERLVAVPDQNQQELPDAKMSYEPLWVFEDGRGNPLPPRLDACKLIIDTVYAAQYANHNLARYKDPEESKEGALEAKRERVDKLVEELFGDETGLMGQTLSRNQGGGQAIIVPHTYTSRENK